MFLMPVEQNCFGNRGELVPPKKVKYADITKTRLLKSVGPEIGVPMMLCGQNAFVKAAAMFGFFRSQGDEFPNGS